MRFADPWFLALVPVIAWWLWLRARPSRRPAVLYSGVGPLKALPRSMAQRLKPLLPLLEGGGLVLLAVALARPQAGREDSVVSTYGVAVQLVIDRSNSMAELDIDPDPHDRQKVTRLDVVKSVVADFVDPDGDLPGRSNDLVGLVSFAGYVQANCPLTLDHAAFLQLLDDVTIPAVDQRDPTSREMLMTAVGDALVIAVDRLREAPATSKVAVLLSDGKSNIGASRPRDGAEAARDAGVRVYTVGVGTPGQGLDEAALEEVAELTGARYFNARDAAGLRSVYEEIDKLERSEITSVQFTRWRERFLPFLLSGLAMLVLHRVLLDTRFRSLP
ncbi:MAG: VWA domain-containing protein [Planctomycetota bacterium]